MVNLRRTGSLRETFVISVFLTEQIDVAVAINIRGNMKVKLTLCLTKYYAIKSHPLLN